MPRSALKWGLPLACLLAVTGPQQRSRGIGRLDSSTAFYYPGFAAEPGRALAETRDGPISVGTYLKYLAARLGKEHLEDLAFDLLLARECKARRLAGVAPTLARPLGGRRFLESGRRPADDPDGSVQRKFANEALRQIRIDALVQADRTVDEGEVRRLFERRYGIGGRRDRVRRVLVAFTATRRSLEEFGLDADRASVLAKARERVETLLARFRAGTSFEKLLRESDDRHTRRMLREKEAAAKVGDLSASALRRLGGAAVEAVRKLQVGAVSAPVQTKQGFHLLQLVDRKDTEFAAVAEGLRLELRRQTTSPLEVRKLRRALFAKYGLRFE